MLIRLSPRVRGVIRPLEISSSPVCKSLAGPLTYGGDISFHSHARNNLKSFVRYLEIECWKRAELRELEPVLQAVAESCKQINKLVQRAQTDDLYGVALGADGLPLEDTNIQGEVQQQLDVLCNTMMLRAFCGCSSSIHSVASEEEDEPRCCSDVMVGVNKMFLLLDAACRLDSTSLTLLRLLPFSLSASVFSLD